MAGPIQLYFDVWPAATPASGAALGELTQASDKKIQKVLSDVGAGQFTINRHDSQAAWCETGNLVRVRLVAGGPFAWNSSNYKFAFYIEDRTDEIVSPDEEAGDEWTRGGRGILSVLERLVWWSTTFISGGSVPRTDGKWHWTNDQFGDIFHRAILEWNARSGPIPDTLTIDFSSSVDSDGAAWPTFAGGYEIDVGQDYLASSLDLCSQGLEIGMKPDYTTQAWINGGKGTNKAATVAFRHAYNIRQAGSRVGHGPKRATRALVRGNNNVFVEATDALTAGDEAGKWGRREVGISFQKSEDTAPLTRAGQQALRTLRASEDGPPQFGVTSYGLGSDGGSPPARQDWIPFTDYEEGDTVTFDVPGEYANVAKRIHSITIEDGVNGEAEVTLTLDSAPFDGAGSGGSSAADVPGGGAAGCDCPPNPSFPPVIEPDTPGTSLWHWSWNTNDLDDTSTYSGGLIRHAGAWWGPADAAFGVGNYGSNSAPHRATQKFAVPGNTPLTFRLPIMWQYNPAVRDVTVQWFGSGGTALLLTETLVVGAGHATSTEYLESVTLTSPVGADQAVVDFSPFAGVHVDDLDISTAGIAAENSPFALADPGVSPFAARSDDPRFERVDGHVITRLTSQPINNSGATLLPGAVVVGDETLDEAVTQTTAVAAEDRMVGLVLQGAEDGDPLLVLWQGVGPYAPDLGAAETTAPGEFLFTSATAGEANADATRAVGAFARVVTVDTDDKPVTVEWWGIPDSSSASVVTGTLGYYFPEDYGAVGDGTTNDLTAINDCVADLIATRGTGTVFFMAPQYAIAGGVISVHPASAQDGIHFQGAQENSLGDVAGTVIIQQTNNTGGFDIHANAYQTSFSNIGVSGPATHSSGIGIKSARQIIPHNLTVQHFHIGIELGSSSYYTGGARAMVYDCDIGVRFVDGSNNTDLYGWRISTCGVGWQVEGHEKFAAFGGVIEACPIGIDVDSGTNTTGGVTLAGIYFENPASSTDIRLGNTTLIRGVVVSGCKFTNHTGGFHIDAKNVDALTIVGNDFRKTTGTAVRTQSPATGVLELPNHYSGATNSYSGNARILDPETDVSPAAVAAAGAVGTSRYFPRADHAHARGTTPANTVSITDTGSYYTGTDVEAALQEIGAGGIGGSSSSGTGDHAHIVDELFSGDGAITVFSLANEAVPETAMAYIAGVRTPVTVGGAMNDEITFAAAPGSGTDNVSVDYVAVAS